MYTGNLRDGKKPKSTRASEKPNAVALGLYNHANGQRPCTLWDRSVPSPLGRSGSLSLPHFVMIFVRDQERSLRFYVDQLGFRLLVDQTFESGGRWIEVGPPDGSANIALALAKPDSDAYKLVGRDSQIYCITEDVTAKFKEWSGRGVRFQFPPQVPAWGGIFTRFEDVDGNSFGLAGLDELPQVGDLQGLSGAGEGLSAPRPKH